MRQNEEVSEKLTPQTYPIPDKTAVYGPYDKKILTEIGAYPDSRVVVTGQPRYDVLARAAKIFCREKTLEKLELDPKKKLVLWASQSQGMDEEENNTTFSAVYGAMKTLTGAQLLIKLHPGEKDSGLHAAKAKDAGVEAAVSKQMDIYEAVYACDVLITKDSTVGIEAAILDKPIIVLNLSGRPDYVSYVEDRIALGVYDAADLSKALEKALYDEDIKKSLAEARKTFVYDRAYKMDGGASKRVANVIDEMVSERTA